MGRKKFDIRNMKLEEHNHQEFIEDQDGDLFDVKNFFWEFLEDAIAKKYYTYGNPLTTAPVAKVKAYDRYSEPEIIRILLSYERRYGCLCCHFAGSLR